MQTEATDHRPKLQAGQLWRIEHGYVRIVEVGNRLVHYKALRQPHQPAALTRMIGIEHLLKYLTFCEGELVTSLQVGCMPANLMGEARAIAEVNTAIAKGNLSLVQA